MMHKLFSRCSVWVLVSVLISVVFVASVAAQDAPSTTRDPQSLAQRYLGFKGNSPIPPLTPAYKTGDKAQFWVGKVGSVTPVRVSATLAAVAPDAYIWVEDGIAVTGKLPQI